MPTSSPPKRETEPDLNGTGPAVAGALCEVDCEEWAVGFVDTPLGPLSVCYEHSLDLVR